MHAMGRCISLDEAARSLKHTIEELAGFRWHLEQMRTGNQQAFEEVRKDQRELQKVSEQQVVELFDFIVWECFGCEHEHRAH